MSSALTGRVFHAGGANRGLDVERNAKTKGSLRSDPKGSLEFDVSPSVSVGRWRMLVVFSCMIHQSPSCSGNTDMCGRLKNKVAVVLGAGSSGPGWGNGKAAAVLFAREKAKVFAVDVRREAAEETAGIIAAEGGDAMSFAADVSKAEDMKSLADACVKAYGRVDILLNNVGILAVGGPEDLSEEAWDRHLAVNVKSVFLSCKYLLPILMRQSTSAIVNISSIASIRYTGYPSAAYNASKGAVNQLTQNIAVQYAAKGVRANCVLPGLMNTPMIRTPLENAYGPGGVDEMIRLRDAQVPMGKMGDAWDVAHAALFLASDEAKYITGALLVVDGGLTCKCS
jgi:NAD(P)-dependent dehydrogenase (short-subunit alcohol dehydrogenase family)